MTRPYSVDLRERVVRAVEAGASCGSVAPDRYGGWKRSALAAHGARVRELLMLEPDLTIAELRRRLAGEKITTGPAAIPGRCRPDAKKRPGTPPSRNGPTSSPRGSPGACGNRR